jgi:hypothetical protein
MSRHAVEHRQIWEDQVKCLATPQHVKLCGVNCVLRLDWLIGVPGTDQDKCDMLMTFPFKSLIIDTSYLSSRDYFVANWREGNDRFTSIRQPLDCREPQQIVDELPKSKKLQLLRYAFQDYVVKTFDLSRRSSYVSDCVSKMDVVISEDAQDALHVKFAVIGATSTHFNVSETASAPLSSLLRDGDFDRYRIMRLVLSFKQQTKDQIEAVFGKLYTTHA